MPTNIIRRSCPALIAALPLIFAGPFLFGQGTENGSAAASPAAPGPNEVVQMSAFEVTTTQGHGYVATNADAGFKTVQKLLDIPQDMQVVTRDLIDDIGAVDSSTLMQYFGTGSSGFQGEVTSMRGSSSKYPYVDDMPENQPYSDPFFVDSYVVIRGESQVLYLNANGVGMVAKYTKKPLPFQQTILTGAVTDWGGTRVMLDTTGPIGQFGDVKLSYRFAAVEQGPSYYFYNVHEDREGLYGVLQAQIGPTILRFYNIQVDDVHSPTGEDFVQPNGKLYTGAGPREANVPPNDLEHFEMHRTHILVDTKATDNWEFRFGASYWRGISAGPVIETNSYNWATQTENFFSNEREITTDYWTMIGDASGKWNLGPLAQQDNFGYSYTDQLTHHYTPPTSQFVTGAINIPFNSVAAINSLVVPPSSAYPGIGTPGTTVATHTQTYATGIYWQHQTDIVPKYLTAVVGWTWATISSDSAGNVAVLPYAATVTAASDWIHRFGAVFHPIKDVSLYGLISTGFTPPSGTAPVDQNGNSLPPITFTENEAGIKTAFLGGKINSTFAIFKGTTTNNAVSGPGVSPITGTGYYILVGSSQGQGVDGNIELFLTKNWQLLAYGYSGHVNDVNGLPLPSTYDNSWSVFTRYAFLSDSPLKGLIVGGGAKEVGTTYLSTANINGYAFPKVPAGSTQVFKDGPGFDSQAFVTYPFTRHLTGRLSCVNITDNHYPIGNQGAVLIDPSPPRTITLELDCKF